MQAHDAARPLDTDDPFGRMDSFVEATRAAVHVRRVDKLLMLRPEKTLGVNDTALDILEALYRKNGPPAREALTAVAARYGVALDRLAADAQSLLDAIRAMMREDFQPQKAVRYASFERGRVKYPVLAEIALTWKCQNRCAFCYAASPSRKDPAELMSSAQVERVIDRIYEEAHVPSLSFTGGEATLRRDLPALVQYASARGLRTNLITNGLRASRYDFAARLVDSGLASAQVSIEADEAGLHDRVVGRRGAFARTVAGIRNFRRLGIHVHTNTTLCQANLHRARDIVRFVALELGLPTMSMNMLIRTGMGLDPASAPLSYAAIAEVLPGLLDEARQHKLKLVWYSPIPYCIVNPVLLGQGAKSCACVSGILSVDPTGQLLPCSSFQQGLGSLLHDSFETIYQGGPARYWRERRYVPPACEGCDDVDLCAGACPLYWDAAGSFAELPQPEARDLGGWRRWVRERANGGSFGVPCPAALGGAEARSA